MRRLLVPPFIVLALAGNGPAALAETPGEPLSANAAGLQPPPQPEMSQVVLRANRKDAVLERRTGSVDLLEEDGTVSGTASLWTRVCTAPCHVAIPHGEKLRIAGDGVTPSSPFTLDPRHRGVRIEADAGSQSLQSLGKTFVSTGLGLVALGTVLVVIPASGDDPSSESAFKTLRTVGYGALGAGGALAISGIPLWVMNGTTVTLSGSGGSSPGRAPSGVVFSARRALF